ncbi:hypothetical protein [Effusibacillus dendaii]|uniref:Uncharacterized protein n=1 Tax=Effusibacillus dendaii TaxID=2743772 RepID=A0A7I8DEN5_9BACL|nr:hypothetical protein [Effusibacillus dendaii]BCJ88584.1 hypothetical protein skT53_35690 [Effusibacillus dendaii]
MYETFVKEFIDIMDERAPVTLVRNRIDIPLGSVEAEQSTLIHSRLDLADEGSPHADVVISQGNGSYKVDFIAHVPTNDRITDEQFISQIREVGQVESVSVLQSIDGQHDDTYVVTGRMDIRPGNDDQNTNSATHDISEKIVSIMKAGGYQLDDTANANDLVLWSPE